MPGWCAAGVQQARGVIVETGRLLVVYPEVQFAFWWPGGALASTSQQHGSPILHEPWGTPSLRLEACKSEIKMAVE